LGVETLADNSPARYNVAPTQSVPTARVGAQGSREFARLRWGLVPFWSKDAKGGAFRMINARSETIASKPAFRKPFKERRCLIAADGYYEWCNVNGEKQGHYIFATDHAMLMFAGVWDRWRGPADEVVESCAIVTTEASVDVNQIHDRMPVILDLDGGAAWLDSEAQPSYLGKLMTPAPQGTLTSHGVNKFVNNVRNDGPECIDPHVWQ
jgi:putative SOS response-associated peptidase YedK